MPASLANGSFHRRRLVILITCISLFALPLEGRGAAAAKTRCTFSKRVLKVKLRPGATTRISRKAGGDIKVRGCRFKKKKKKPRVGNTRAIRIRGASGNESVTIDVTGGRLGGKELIDISVRLKAGDDVVKAVGDADLGVSDETLTIGDLAGATLSGIERASLTGGPAANVLDASKFSGPVTMLGSAGDDELISGTEATALSGGEGEDRLIAGPGDDVLDGGPGEDHLQPGEGDDEIDGGEDTDILEVIADVDLEVDDISLTGGLGTDSLASIERAFIVGGPSPNILDATGFTGRVTLAGLGGDDSLTGGSGDDALVGDGFGDLHGGDSGSDTIEGGAGEDLFYLEASGNITLQDNFVTTDTTTDVLVEIESAHVKGSEGGDLFDVSGWSKDATLDGGDGLNFLVDIGTGSRALVDSADVPDQAVLTRVTPMSAITFSNIGIISLTGGPQPETIDAFGYTLTSVFIDGLGGDDLLIGGTLGDLLKGGDGDDELRGGDGDDTLTGGDGDDLFNCGAGTDDVTDYDPVDDIMFPDC